MSDAEVVQAEQRAEQRAMREDLVEIKAAMTKVADALERLARLEERHSTVAGALERAFGTLSKLDARVRALEQSQPVQKLTSGWVLNLVYGAAGAVATLIVTKAFGG